MLSEPVVGEQFFARDEVLQLLQKRVNALKEGYRQNIALTGQNLSGKSSILHHFLYTFRDTQILPIYVEVTDEPFSFFSRRFTGSLLYNFLKTKGVEPKEDFDSLLDESRGYIPRTVKSIIDIQDLIKKKGFDQAYLELLNLTSVIKEETNKSCVIIFDEFHNLASLNVKHPFKNFGKKIMIQKDTMYIVTSSQVTTVKKILNEKLSLLFGNFEIVQVGGFKSKNASSFLDQRFRYMRVPKEYKNFIISFTDGNPFYLDVISHAIKDIVMSMTFKRITQEILIRALEKTIFNSKGCISQYLNNSLETIRIKKASEIYIAILSAVANGSYRLKEISKAVKKRTGDVSRYASELIEANILYKNGAFYKFVDKMFGFWFKHVYQKKRSAIISYLPDRIEIFHKEMREIIDRFLVDERREITQRISQLFGHFNNETVTISDKEYRLPSFSSTDIKYFENGEPYILSQTKNKYWITSVYPEEIKDIDIMEFIERCKTLKLKTQGRVFVALSGVEMNARLMAKEEKIWLWDLDALNYLMLLYGKEKAINIIHRGVERKIV